VRGTQHKAPHYTIISKPCYVLPIKAESFLHSPIVVTPSAFAIPPLSNTKISKYIKPRKHYNLVYIVFIFLDNVGEGEKFWEN
jgi:hypothetical protein